MATVGCIIGATAPNVNQLIGGNVLIGLATAGQLSFNYILTELVPVKHRFYILSGVFLVAIPFSAFGPVISRLLIVNTKPGWRWDYYMNIIVSKSTSLQPCGRASSLKGSRRCLDHTLCHILPSTELRRATQG